MPAPANFKIGTAAGDLGNLPAGLSTHLGAPADADVAQDAR